MQFTIEVNLNKKGSLRQLMKTSLYDYCAFAKKHHKGNSIVEMVYQQLLNTSNVPKNGCPVPPGRYVFNGLTMDMAKLPSVFPTGTFVSYCNLLTLENNTKIVFAKLGMKVKIDTV